MKFAKYLKRHGKDVHVLAAQMDVDKHSPWDDDAREVEAVTHRLHFRYPTPYFKKTQPSTLSTRVRWHASKWYHRLKGEAEKPGNPADESERYAPAFLKKARTLIREKQIRTVIFTASPNHLAYHLSGLKEEFPSVRFVFDLRDYWSDWMPHLDHARQQYEAGLERQTIQRADLIYSPAQKIVDTLRQRYPEKAGALRVLPHAFDHDDFKSLEDAAQPQSRNRIRLVYAGTMYEHMEDNMRVLASLLHHNPLVDLTFYTFTQDYREFFGSFAERVHYVKPVPVKLFTRQMQHDADAMLYMRSTMSDDSNFLSSKFFDFLPLRKPIIYLGPEGDALAFIRSERIGFHLGEHSVAQFGSLMDACRNSLQRFDPNPYSFDALTRQLEQDLEH